MSFTDQTRTTPTVRREPGSQLAGGIEDDALTIVRELIRDNRLEGLRKQFIEKYPDFEKRVAPRDRYRLEVLVNARSIDECVNELRNRWLSIRDHWAFPQMNGRTIAILHEEPEMTKERFEADLDRYLKECRAQMDVMK